VVLETIDHKQKGFLLQ